MARPLIVAAWLGVSGAAAADEPTGEAPPELTPIDVEVREPPRPPETTSMTRAEARQMPGAFGDPFRAIEALPGIVPLVSGVPYFYVRGSPPGNVGYFLDGIRVPLLFHMGLGPSVLHPALVSSVELTPGPAPELGRHAGGAVAATLAEPSDRVRVEGSLRAVDTGAFVEVPFDDARGSVMAAGRFSYAAWLFSLANSSTSLSYWDYAGRFSYDIRGQTRVTLFGFGAFDFFADKLENGEEERVFDTMFHRVDVRLDHEIDPRTRVRHDVVIGFDQTRLDERRDVVDLMFQSRTAAVHRPDDGLEVRFGFDVVADDYAFDLDRGSDDGFVSFFRSRRDAGIGAWAVAAVRLADRFSLLPGLCADGYVSSHETAFSVDPSVATALDLGRGVSLVQMHGLASQMPSFIVAGPGFRPGLDQGGLQRAFHSSFGVVYEPDRIWTLKASLYRVAFFEINDALGTSPLSGEGFPDGLDEFDRRVLGTSIGLELSARRRLSRGLGMMLAYTMGRSERSSEGVRLPSGFDRTHVASAALAFDFGGGFFGGLRNLFYTGAPLVTDEGATPATEGRLAPFYRLDWRFEKKWKLGRSGWISLVAEVANTFLADEETGQDCQYELFDDATGVKRVCRRTTLGPVTIPSLGVEGGYF